MLKAPLDGFDGGVNPVTGRTADIPFSWERLSKATAYKLYIAYDSGFDEEVTSVAVASTKSTVVQTVGPYQTIGEDEQVEFMPGTTYYWRIKVTGPVSSPYSATYSFTIKEAVAPVTEVTVEPAPAPEIVVEPAPAPEIVVEVPPYPEPAPAIPSYMLWMIIGIGAVLVIALIVLIVRTRRVV